MRYLQPGIKYFLIRGTIWDVYEMYEIFAARYKIYFDVSYIIWDVQGRILHQKYYQLRQELYWLSWSNRDPQATFSNFSNSSDSKAKVKVKGPNKCYIFEKHGIQGYQI